MRPPAPIRDPYAAAASNDAGLRARVRDLSEQYDREIADSIERWRVGHDREYTEHRIAVLKSMRFMGKKLSARQQESVDAKLEARIRDAEHWPTRAAYIRRHMPTAAVST